MTKITLSNEELDLIKEINIVDNWKEIILKDYFKIIELVENKDNIVEELFFTKMLAILSNENENELMDYPLEQFTQITSILETFNTESIDMTQIKNIEIDGITYVPKKNMSNVTTNEIIWIKNLQKGAKTSSDLMLGTLVILLRPGYEKKDEAGVVKWIQTPYNNDDFETRKAIFLNKLYANNAIPLFNFFLNGNKN